MMKNKLLTLTAALVAASATSHAAIIADFQFSNLTSSDAGTSWTTTATTGIGNADGIQNHGIISDIANPGSSFALSMGDINGAFTGSNYAPFFEFTVTPDGGGSIDFTTFDVDLYKLSGGADVVATLKWNVDSYAASLASSTVSATGSWKETTGLDISSLASITSATTFRVELFTTGGSPGNEIRVDNIVLNGTVTTVPEPSSALLGGLGFLALLHRRRRA